MKSWPTAFNIDSLATSMAKSQQLNRKSRMTINLFVISAKNKDIRNVNLFTLQYIKIVDGLQSDFSWAWKSGKKPSPIKDIIKNKLPNENKDNG